jgi:hypothetical protein
MHTIANGLPACNSGNVVSLRPRVDTVSPFDRLTARIVMQRHASGTLDPAIVAALLLAAGLQP